MSPATSALFAACERADIKRVVHISAIGASTLGADRVCAQQGRGGGRIFRGGPTLDWVILRPGLVLAPTVYGGTAMLRGVAGLPFRHAGARARCAVAGGPASTT